MEPEPGRQIAASDVPPDRDSQDPDGHSSSGWVSGFRIVSLLTLASRALGLTRDILMAAAFGNGVVMDAFSVAFRIPNLARRLFGEGAMSTAFLPVFVREYEQNGQQTAWTLASTVLTALAGGLLLLVLFVELGLGALFAYVETGTESDLLIILTAMMFPYLVLICLAAQFNAILHARDHFTKPALLPVVLNVVWIATLIFIVPTLKTDVAKISAVALGILVGGVLQLLTPIPTLSRMGFRFRTDWRTHRETVLQLGRTLLPVLLGLSITQINTVADSVIAWAFSAPTDGVASMDLFGGVDYPMETGTASALYFAQRMYQFPLGVFGVALGTVLFPLFSRQAAAGQMKELAKSAGLGLRLILAVGMPASVGLILLCEPLTALLFQHGAFDSHDAEETSRMIAFYGGGVWAFGGLLISQRVFYSVGDTQTPLRIGLLAVVVNLLLNFVLIWPLGGYGLALATSVTAAIQFGFTVILIRSRIGDGEQAGLLKTVGKTAIATVAMSGIVLLVLHVLPDHAGFLRQLLRVAIPFSAAVFVFFATAKMIGLHEPWLLFRRDKMNPQE